MPESVDHRDFTEALAYFAALALGPSMRVCRGLAWYPTPNETAMAPDAMVLPARFVPDGTTSYRQAIVGGPVPTFVAEVVSDGNDFGTGLAKLRRLRQLGVPALVVDLDRKTVELFEASGLPLSCLDRPFPELGGIRIVEDAEQGLLVQGIDGRRARRVDVAAAELSASLATEVARAASEAARADRLAEALRALGHDPSTI